MSNQNRQATCSTTPARHPQRSQRHQRLQRFTWLLFALLLLSACARPINQPENGRPAVEPAAAVRGEELPGRLLFVREGVIWFWEDGLGRPLSGNGNLTQPAIGRDTNRMVYVARTNSSSDLILADREGRELQRLTDNGSNAPPNSLERVLTSRWAFYPVWSPDGTAIVFAGQAGTPGGDPPAEYNLALYRVAVGGGQRELLYGSAEAHCGRAVYTPDGSAIIFTATATSSDGQTRLYRLDAAGNATPLPGVPAPSYDPAFSPDGAWLVFAARDGARTDIFALPAGNAAAAPLRLTSLGSARAPAFSPDGSRLAFLALNAGGGFDLWVSDLSRDQAGGLQAAPPRQITSGLYLDADAGLSWGD